MPFLWAQSASPTLMSNSCLTPGLQRLSDPWGKYVSVRTDSATDDLARYLMEVEDGALYKTREVPHSQEVSPSFVCSLCARCTVGESVAGFWNRWSVHNDSDIVYSWTSAWCCAHKLWLS